MPTLARRGAANRAWGTATRTRPPTQRGAGWLGAGRARSGRGDLAELGRRRSASVAKAARRRRRDRLCANLPRHCSATARELRRRCVARSAYADLLAGGAGGRARLCRAPMPQAKRAAGAVDFDDLIRDGRRAAASGRASATGCATSSTRRPTTSWSTRRRTPTRAQWTIVAALADEFFAGARRYAPADAHAVHGRRLQAGDLRLPGHRPGEFRRRAGHFGERAAAWRAMPTGPRTSAGCRWRSCRSTAVLPLDARRCSSSSTRRSSRGRRAGARHRGSDRAHASEVRGPGQRRRCGRRCAADGGDGGGRGEAGSTTPTRALATQIARQVTRLARRRPAARRARGGRCGPRTS